MLTRNDVCLLNEQYITITKEEDNFIELHSDSTGYCWTIFYNQFEKSNKYTIYYKTNEKEKSFHQHSLCQSASDAARRIMHRDQQIFAEMKKTRRFQRGCAG